MSDHIDSTATSATPSAAATNTSPFGTATRRSRILRVSLIVTFLLAALLLAFRLSPAKKAPEAVGGHAPGAAPTVTEAPPVSLDARAARRIGVTYAAVTRGIITTEVRTVAEVTYDETRVKAISSKIDGWVENLLVNVTGQPVTIGDPLLTIYSPMLVSAQQELLLAGRLGVSVSQAEGDARKGVEELRAAARRRLQYWDISDAQIDQLERTGNVTKTLTLRSPVQGVIVDKNVLAGQRIMAGDALYRVADLRVVWLEGEVFERDLASIRLGQTVTAEFDALAGEKRVGRIAYLYPTLDPDTRTARIRVELANPDLQLKPGMYGTIHIAGSSAVPEVLVPRSAILATGERYLVFVRRPDGRLESREVVTGLSTDTQTQILRGLSPGDTVVSSGTFLVDAESNLGSALGGMGSMPGMDMAPPASTGPRKPSKQAPTSPSRPGATTSKSMPDMPMPSDDKPREED